MRLIERPSQKRLALAVALLISSILFTIAFTAYSQRGQRYWIARDAILPGTEITETSLTLAKLSLGSHGQLYFSEVEPPSLLLSKRYYSPGELIARSGVSDGTALSLLVPLNIRSADIPESARVGDLASLYWVLDTRNEELFEPEEIAHDIYIESINRRGSNFGSDLAVTVSVPQSLVHRLLSYTSGGRIVVIPSHG